MLSLTRRIGETVEFSDAYGPIATLVLTEVRGEEAAVFTFTPMGEAAVSHAVPLRGDAELCNGAGRMGSVRVTGLLGGVRARLAFDFPREIGSK